MTDDWKNMVGPDVPCPISFSRAEEERQMETWRRATAREKWVEALHERLHVKPDGIVDPDQYESMKRAAKAMRPVWDEKVAGPWPLQDGAWPSLL